jgi:hypothetical protein
MKLRDQLLITTEPSTKWNHRSSPNKPLGRPGHDDPWLIQCWVSHTPTWGLDTTRSSRALRFLGFAVRDRRLAHSHPSWQLEHRHLLRVDQIGILDLDRHRSCTLWDLTTHTVQYNPPLLPNTPTYPPHRRNESNVEFLFSVSHGGKKKKVVPDCAAPLN